MSTSASRDMRFDWLRVAGMMLIIACHFISNIGWNLESTDDPWIGGLSMAADQLLGQVGSCFFFLITGYFLVAKQFNVRRIVNVILQTFLYSLLFLVLQLVLLWVHPTPGVKAIFSSEQLPITLYSALLPVFNGAYWFITAYVLLLLVSPYLNRMLASDAESLRFIAFLLGISIMGLFSMTQLFWNNWCYAITGYLLGGWIRLYGKDSIFCHSLRWPYVGVATLAAYCLLVVFDFCAMNLGLIGWLQSDARYITGMIPALSIGVASLVFILVTRSRMDFLNRTSLSNSGKLISSTVFGVYLIHNNPYVRPNLWEAITEMLPEPSSFVFGICLGLLVVIVLFAICAIFAYIYDTFFVEPLQNFLWKIF
ncbi:acyltransferase family protein [Bifidobacterium samirii]|uniref:Proline symporter n=1 Tax=Bifidobacterium samirii TaxID=2306974 RepID=A0A430FR36_9BIFI|nr:acyltransferase [Bifidobacterium samirii]RSX55313.1 proline symporter [Bifidobacterium samirii]